MRSKPSFRKCSSKRVQEEFRHVLNSKMARYGELTKEQMYNAVKRHKVYLGRTKHLREGEITPITPQKSTPSRTSNSSFKPWFQKTMAFVAAPLEELSPTPADSEFDASESLYPMLTLPRMTTLASTFQTFSERQMMENGGLR